jgi:hypothetical protein
METALMTSAPLTSQSILWESSCHSALYSLVSVLLATCFHAGFILGLFFDPEDRGDMLLRNVG